MEIKCEDENLGPGRVHFPPLFDGMPRFEKKDEASGVALRSQQAFS
jgi:hypothetical protein